MAAACGPAEDAQLPWWPTPSVAAPSPLLDAVGFEPPRLDGPGCHRGGSAERSGLRGALLRLATGIEVTCFTPPSAAAGTDADAYAAVTFDGRGRAETADRQVGALTPDAAATAADSVIRRGLGLPGARPIVCPMEGWPYAVLRSDGVVPQVRGWRTLDYDALVLAYPAGAEPARGAVVHLRASRRGFAGCQE
jgi:hypothetical protein